MTTERPEPAFRLLRLDYDGPFPEGFVERVDWVMAQMGVRARRIGKFPSHSGQGFHAMIELDDALPAIVVVALQAILGSDYKRETYNLQRALLLADAPAFWQSRWNVLYSEKLGRTDAMPIDLEKYSASRPVLKPHHLDGADVAPLTITHVEEVTLGGDQPKLVLQFAEFDGFNYWPNVTSIRRLVDALGDDERKWMGQRVVLEVTETTNPQRDNEKTSALWVAAPGEWAQYGVRAPRVLPVKRGRKPQDFAADGARAARDVAKRGRKAAAKKTSAKRGRKPAAKKTSAKRGRGK